MGAFLHKIGLISEERMRGTLQEAAGYADEPMRDQYEAACALEEFGVAVSVHADDIDSIEFDYASLLEDAATVAGNRVGISNVRLVAGEGEFAGGRFDVIEFERDGELVSIDAEHFADDYFDQGAACQAIAETAHEDDPRDWQWVDFEREENAGYDDIMLLATPDQRAALREQYGFTYPWNSAEG